MNADGVKVNISTGVCRGKKLIILSMDVYLLTRKVKQNLLSNVPAADYHPNYFSISPSY